MSKLVKKEVKTIKNSLVDEKNVTKMLKDIVLAELKANAKVGNKKKANKASFGNIYAAPMALSVETQNLKPRIKSRNGCMCIDHKEFFANVSGAGSNPSVNQFQVNPGLNGMFPWLAFVAANFETYRFRRLAVRFISRVSASTSGAIMNAADYDAADLNVQITEQTLGSFEGAKETNIWKEMLFHFNPLYLNTVRYVRSTGVPGQDIKTYDLATFYSMLIGITDTSTYGKLWVEYEIELYTPQINVGAIAGGDLITQSGVNNFWFSYSPNQALSINYFPGSSPPTFTISGTGYKNNGGGLQLFPAANGTGAVATTNTNYLGITGMLAGVTYTLTILGSGTGTSYNPAYSNIYNGTFANLSYPITGTMAMNNSVCFGGVIQFQTNNALLPTVILFTAPGVTTLTGVLLNIRPSTTGLNLW